MAHDFKIACDTVKASVEGVVAVDALRDGLNRASTRFKAIDDDDFESAPILRSEFRGLRARLRRRAVSERPARARSLDELDSAGMVALAQTLLEFSRKMELANPAFLAAGRPAGVLSALICDPGPD